MNMLLAPDLPVEVLRCRRMALRRPFRMESRLGEPHKTRLRFYGEAEDATRTGIVSAPYLFRSIRSHSCP